MSYRNYYRVEVSDEFLGVSKILSASTRWELEQKIENQRRIWDEKTKREVLKQNKEQLKLKADKMTKQDEEKFNSYNSLIKNIGLITSKEFYNSLLDRRKFNEFSTNLLRPNIQQVYEEVKVPKKSVLEKFLKSKELKRIEKEKQAEEVFKIRENYYNEQLQKLREEYEGIKTEFTTKQEKHNAEIIKRKEEYSSGNKEEIEAYYSYVLENSVFPEDFIKDFEVQYYSDRKTLVVSYYLPNENSIPKIIQHKYIASRNEIDEIKLNDKKFENFYNDVIYMCCLKTIKEIFNSDDKDFIDTIVYNGWIKYINKSTGRNAESCILTVQVEKEKFNEIDLDKVEYKACIRGLKGLCSSNLLSLDAVMPYLNIDRNDSRFIDSKEVKEIGIDGFNLATMPWEDFEYFVRELFDKMFNVNGGEVKVTQASHDGGVDAIAFDDDPIRGGKFVIQAKRYNNVVSVSAVRDLYGTMLHEGATKGILVTTSSFGKDAYAFAKDKPITLIDGQNLLGLLNKYGYSNLTIKLNKKN